MTRIAEHLDRLRDDGFTVLEDVIEPDLVDELRATVLAIQRDQVEHRPRSAYEGQRTTRTYNLLAKGRAFERIPAHPGVLPLVEAFLDEGCLISSLCAISIDPGERSQPIHADDAAIRMPKPHPVPTVCTTIWAIDDFTEANGATRVLPGSHRADASPDWMGDPEGDARRQAASIPVTIRSGSVLVLDGSLWHGGGPNATDRSRLAVGMSYCAGWVRPVENQLLGVPPERARAFPNRLRQLCGYGIYNGVLNHVDKVRPANLVLGPAPDEGPGRETFWEGPVRPLDPS